MKNDASTNECNRRLRLLRVRSDELDDGRPEGLRNRLNLSGIIIVDQFQDLDMFSKDEVLLKLDDVQGRWWTGVEKGMCIPYVSKGVLAVRGII